MSNQPELCLLPIAIVPSTYQKSFKIDAKYKGQDKIPQRVVLAVDWKKDNRNKALDHYLSILPYQKTAKGLIPYFCIS